MTHNCSDTWLLVLELKFEVVSVFWRNIKLKEDRKIHTFLGEFAKEILKNVF
jgi:hypothetical protein